MAGGDDAQGEGAHGAGAHGAAAPGEHARGEAARGDIVAGARAPRGSYAKGIAKREEILEAALDVVATKGYRGASVREIADAVGLSQAGLLHYFGTKEELFVEILRVRDEQDRSIHLSAEAAGTPDRDLIGGYLSVIRHNAEVPGVVQLYSQMAVEGADPAHPAHDYFLTRGEELRRSMQPALHDMQPRGAGAPGIPPETLARIIQAVSDGVQLQWLLDPEVDMAAVVEALLGALHGTPGGPRPENPRPERRLPENPRPGNPRPDKETNA